MIKNKGVYTTKCPECSRSILMHVFADGSVSPNKCSECEAEFGGLEYGEERNTFIIVVKTNESKIVVNEEAEVRPESDSDTRSEKGATSTKKASKKYLKW